MNSLVRNKLSPKQTLAMTPELLQSVKLLGLSNADLRAFVDARLQENPFLEAGNDKQMDAPPAGLSLPAALPSQENLNAPASASKAQHYQAGGGEAGGSVDNAIEQLPDTRVSLFEHLGAQIRLQFSDQTEQLIAYEIVASLDESGFLRRPLASIADDIGANEEDVARVLRAVQKFDPVGIAARSLEECFQRQLEEEQCMTPAMERLLSNLNLLADGETAALQRLCNVDEDALTGMIAALRRLTPIPSKIFDTDVAQQIVPDVIVKPGHHGAWDVTLNPQALPKVLVNKTYHAEIKVAVGSEDERKFVTDSMATANWLARSLNQRARTILKVASEIVRRQSKFFSHGAEHIEPMSRAEIAEKVGLHESTVCRAVAYKYVLCPSGVMDFDFFFSARLSGTDGSSFVSALAVQQKMFAMLQNETADNVLSDDDVAHQLRAGGVKIARRTVAKYRECMNIPPSPVRRRKLKAVSGSV